MANLHKANHMLNHTIKHERIDYDNQLANCSTKGLSSREAARGHATNVDGEMLSVTINRIYNY